MYYCTQWGYSVFTSRFCILLFGYPCTYSVKYRRRPILEGRYVISSDVWQCTVRDTSIFAIHLTIITEKVFAWIRNGKFPLVRHSNFLRCRVARVIKFSCVFIGWCTRIGFRGLGTFSKRQRGSHFYARHTFQYDLFSVDSKRGNIYPRQMNA